MPEIRELLKEDPTYDNLTKEQEEEMKNELLAHRDLKKKGARTTNKSAAQDYRNVCGSLNDEVRYSSFSLSSIHSVPSRYLPSLNELVPLLLPFSAVRTLKTLSNRIG